MDRPPRAAPGRSCASCRGRKIKCDRKQPCSYCSRMRKQCIYPRMIHPASRHMSEPAVLSRLDQIETSLRRLESAQSIPGNNTATNERTESPFVDLLDPRRRNGNACDWRAGPEQSGGKLVKVGQEIRYVMSSSFWANLEEEQENWSPSPASLETVYLPRASESSNVQFDNSPDEPAPVSSSYESPLQDSVLATSGSLQHLRPSQAQVLSLWQAFLDNVDPMVKVLHAPTVQRQLLRSTQSIPAAFEALMFAIFYAAVTSMQDHKLCKDLLNEDRDVLLEKYRAGVERSLSRADLFGTTRLITLQALTLYLVCLRKVANKTYVWTMAAVAIRLAFRLGLHRDPKSLGLAPFASEMRRRLWWQICILDVRTAEECDMDPSICEHDLGPSYPSNVNDASLHVDMKQPPIDNSSSTEMLFSLTRFEISYTARRLVFSPKFFKDNQHPNLTSAQKDDVIEALQRRLNEKYLDSCDPELPICFFTTVVTKMILAKMKLTIHHPARDGFSGVPAERFTALVQSSIEIIENAHALRVNDKYRCWIWLFEKYIEWDALAFLLHSLNATHLPGLLDRAWSAVDIFFTDWDTRRPMEEDRWRRLEILRERAAAKRTAPTNDIFEFDGVEQLLATTEEDAHCTTTRNELLDWTFDDHIFAMQGQPSWESNVGENTFGWLA